jgi:hypothetical protein
VKPAHTIVPPSHSPPPCQSLSNPDIQVPFVRPCHLTARRTCCIIGLWLGSREPPRDSLLHERMREMPARRRSRSERRARRKSCMQGPDLTESSNLGETVGCRSGMILTCCGIQRTNEMCANLYKASAFPNSAECCNKSFTLIAFPRISSSFLLLFPSWPKVDFVHNRCCNLTAIRTALPNGPCPWKFGKNDDIREPNVVLDELTEGSWVYDGGCAVRVAKVARACLYAREASAA